MTTLPTGGNDWSQIIQLIGALGKTGSGIYSAFQKQPTPYGFAESAQANANANTYMAAAADPNSTYFRNIAESEERSMRGDLVSTIQEIIRATLARQGRGAFVNPERRDETVWRALTQGFRDAGVRARELARSRLMEMSAGSRAGAAAYGPLMQFSFLNQALNRGNQAAGIAGAFDTVSRVGEAMGKKQGTKDFGKSSTPDSTNWYPGWNYLFGGK